jgi:hypothetical protein
MVSAQLVEREWTVNLQPDEARLRCSYRRRGNQLEQYTAQLEIHHGSAWQPIVRYDNAHGFNHCDILHANGTQDKTVVSVTDANAAFTLAIKEIRTNWKAHRQRYLKEIQP